MYNLQPFIISTAQFLVFYTSTGNDIIVRGDHTIMLPILCFCTAYSTTHMPINSPEDFDLIHDLLVFFILPTATMLLYSYGFDTSLTFTSNDTAAIISFCVKIYRLFYL